ncbi:MAG: hypothetical protein LBU60_02670 [Clostridiales bacterium]|jgi:hypothetical protein|nr:hypothetical protein [Clostridiales bacterium]
MKEVRGESNPKIAELKIKHEAIKIEQIKKSFDGVIANGIKRIKTENERAKTTLSFDIINLERELVKLKREQENKIGDSFVITQKIATLSKDLTKLKENEFLTKLKLKKEQEQKEKEFLEQFSYHTYTQFYFEIKFEVV